jgi:hypothetical protein
MTHSEQVAALVERTCRESGVPLKVEDPMILAQIASVLTNGKSGVISPRTGRQCSAVHPDGRVCGLTLGHEGKRPRGY